MHRVLRGGRRAAQLRPRPAPAPVLPHRGAQLVRPPPGRDGGHLPRFHRADRAGLATPLHPARRPPARPGRPGGGLPRRPGGGAGRGRAPGRVRPAMMTSRQALEVLAAHRGNRIVVTTMGAVAVWPALSDTPLDFAYLPSAMGQGAALGLGLALAQPGRGAVVVNGDGGMLMSLGSLVTLASHPADVFLLILDNALYEITGGQPTAGAGRVDFAALARAAGIRRTYAFD